MTFTLDGANISVIEVVEMAESLITQTTDEVVAALRKVIKTRDDAQKQVEQYIDVIRAMLKIVEDEEKKAEYLNVLDEIVGKTGFLENIRLVLRLSPEGLTPIEIKSMLALGNKMDLSAYSNALASIHTTIRRMVDSGEVESFTNDKGEKAYRIKARAKTLEEVKREAAKLRSGRMTPPPER